MLVYLDVGCHKAQEFRVLLCSSLLWIIYRCLKRWAGSSLGRGSSFGWQDVRLTINSYRLYRKKVALTSIYSVLVDPNPKWSMSSIYSKANAYFSVALSDRSGISKLYTPKNDTEGLGASLFKNKPGAVEGLYQPCISLAASDFFHSIQEVLPDISSCAVLLRINCEGAEGLVIDSCYRIFGDRLGLIMGSLKDIEDIHGAASLVSLHNFLSKSKIKYVPFYDDVSTWADALNSVREYYDSSCRK